jgi:transcriptional regulator with XRE-family HTH domain
VKDGSGRATWVSDYVGESITRLREQRGWSRATLAQECQRLGSDIDRQLILRIERRQDDRPRREITVTELFVIARALDVEPARLLPGHHPRHVPSSSA